jgi:outer membrane lipoprotein LolB
MRTAKLLLIALCTLWIASCATTPTNKTLPQNQSQTWGSRVQTLSNVQNWDLSGMIGIRNNAKNDHLSANIKWQQHNKQYSILLFGPLGAGSIKLTGQPGLVKLENSDGKTYTAASPEQLVAQQTHWYLPVSNLYYWIRGLPVPNVPAKTHFDTLNHLDTLQQQGWQVQYLHYTSINNVDIPNKIFLFNRELNVKIIINDWKI